MKERRLEPPRHDRRGQIGIGRGDQPGIDTERRIGPHGMDLAGFERAQQERLHLGRHFAHLVEQQGSAVRPAQVAASCTVGSRKGAARDAEQLGRREGCGQGRHVDPHERPAGAPPGGVDGARDQLFARAGFAAQEDRNVGRRNPPDLAPQRGHRRALPQEALVIGVARTRRDRIDRTEAEDDAVAEQHDRAALDLPLRQLARIAERRAVDLYAHRAARASQENPARLARPDLDRPAAQVRIGERTRAAAAGRCERGLGASEPFRASGHPTGQRRALPGAISLGMVQDRQAGDPNRVGKQEAAGFHSRF